MKATYGATPQEWQHFADRLKLRNDLLPVVSNPDAPISPFSKMVDKGKTPSRYNGDRQVGGITRWTQVDADARDVQRWMKEPDYGICLQTRLVRAVDIDVPDADRAAAIEQAVRDAVPGVHFPLRWRANSGKRILAFRYAGELTKRSVPVDGGIVELLATGQQFVAVGTHPSGARYEWDDGLPAAFPELTEEEVETVWSTIELLFATGESRVAKVARERSSTVGEGTAEDDVALYLAEHGLILDEGVGGQVYLECPWKAGHSSDSGVTETTYFPAGTGGFDCGHFKCLHASCEGRTDEDFLDAIGFNQDTEFRTRDFPLLPTQSVIPHVPGLESGSTLEGAIERERFNPHSKLPAVPADSAPMLKRNKQSEILVTQDNVARAFECPEYVTRKLRYDTFTQGVVWAWWNEADLEEVWTPWGDVDNARAMRTLDRRGFKSTPGIEMVRRAVDDVARQREIDLAVAWLNGLRWDGVERCETFLIDYLGVEDTPYARAVGRYMWTAMAGRCLVPGVQADMAVILVTPEQGRGKTSMIRALVPEEDWFGELDLTLDDDDLGRLMKGKLVCELPELKGLATRQLESIKAFISRRKDEWTPKYMEHTQAFLRRVFMIGTTNDDDFLADPTGERRWLPTRIGRADTAAIRRDRELLWAEARERFKLGGIDWEDAERLATAEHAKFKARDPLQDKVQAWAESEGLGAHVPAAVGFTLEEMVEQCLGLEFVRCSMRDQRRYGGILRALGYVKARMSRGGEQQMVWRRPVEEKN